MSYFIEDQPWGKTMYDIIPGTHVSFTTDHQKVDFITNPIFGRMLFLDGVLQSSTADEEIYHKALVSGMYMGSQRVLIAGGAEGAVAREVFKKYPHASVQMVDWDYALVSHCRNIEKFNKEAFENPRFSYSSKDILLFCEETTQTFDTIFLDLLDIETEEECNKMKQIINWVRDIADDDAKLVMNIGRSKKIAEEFCADGQIIEIFVPSFQEPWYIVKKSLERLII